MSFTITYKTLVRINFLHNYFLDTDDKAFYSLASTEQLNALDKLLSNRRYLMMQHLEIEPVLSTNSIIKGHKLICRKTGQGIIIAIPVVQEIVNDQLFYKPLIPFKDTDRLQFKITIRDADFVSFTNIRLNPVFPASYYFTNSDITTQKTYPSLSAPTSSFVAKKIYEMGEAAVVNNIASQAITRTNKASEGWMKFNDSNYVSEYDRILLPKEFVFLFDQEKVIKAKFILQKDGQAIKTLDLKGMDVISEVPLSFKKTDDNAEIANGIYTLLVTASNSYSRAYTIFLHDELYQTKAWGILDLSLFSETPKFSLLTGDGYLVSDSESPYPVFELRFLSRATYWKYYFQQTAPPGTDPLWDNLPTPAGMQKVIISKQPFSLMNTYREVNYASSPLPNPVANRLSREDDKICSDVMLTKIKL